MLESKPFDVVLDAKLPFVGDDLLFGSYLGLAKHQVRDPVGFELDEEWQRRLGCVLVVIGPVGPRGGVDLRTRGFHKPVELSIPVCLGLVEHQMLEQVGEAGLARFLVARTDAEPSVVADGGGRAVDER